MSIPISESVYNEIHKICKKNPEISSSKVARMLDIDKDTVIKWRSRPKYTAKEEIRRIEVISPPEEHRLKIENRKLKRQIDELVHQKTIDNELLGFAEQLSAVSVKTPKWATKCTSKGADPAIACSFMSDWHLDEVVFRAQVSGINEYNRKIAETRCGQFFDNTVQLGKKYISGVKYEGLYLFIGGDIFSGNIHEELKETNECTIIESLLHWVGPIASGICHLADNYNRIHIPCVVGNHGRNTRKPVAKNRAQDNFDWLFYHMLAMQLKDDERITWDISPAADCLVKIYDTSMLFTHGDQFRGGSGIAGLLSPLLLGDHRKRKRQAAIRQPYDWMVYGHWHSLVLGVRGLLGNGSLKGYDEYAFVSNFDYEPPQQALWLVQDRVGVTGRWPVHVLGNEENYTS